MVKPANDSRTNSRLKREGVQDERFERANYDPKMKRVPMRIGKVKIGKRFQKMLTSDEFSTVRQVDQYGRKAAKDTNNEDMR